MRTIPAAFACWAVLVWCGTGLQAVQAAPILYVHDSDNQLGTVDIESGAVTVIGRFGLDASIEPITDIAFDPDGNLYGISFMSDGSGSTLYRVDSTTAALTRVGAVGLIDQNALVFGDDGTLYSAGVIGTELYSLDTSTGAATELGDIGFSSAGDLAFNGGRLYLSSTTHELVEIDLAGVSGALVGSLGFNDVFGLATANNGVLYGISGTSIFSTDTSTGAGTFVLDYAGQGLLGAFGSAFFTESGATLVPEPGTLTIFGIGLIGLLGFRARRRPLPADDL